MAKLLTEKGRAFRKLVEELDGDLNAVAAIEGVTRPSISHRLNSELHGAWWRSFKKKRSKRRKREAMQRYRQRARERMAGAWPGPSTTDPGPA